QPKQRGRRAAAEPLRTLGQDPVSGQPIVVREGRFGPYVSDGETMASLRRGEEAGEGEGCRIERRGAEEGREEEARREEEEEEERGEEEPVQGREGRQALHQAARGARQRRERAA